MHYPPLVSLNGITKRYGSNTIIDNVSFEICKNEKIAILGNNGAGKTTLLKIVCDLIDIDQGSVDYFFQDPVKNHKNKLGIVLNDPYFIEEFLVKTYLEFVCKFQFIPRAMINERIDYVLKQFDLSDYKYTKIQVLSAGNKAKLSLASALVHNPQLLVLDEPFTHLDISSAQNFLDSLVQLEEGKAILITSHNIHWLLEICSRFIIIKKGKIACDLTVSSKLDKTVIKKRIFDLLVKK